MKKQDDNTSVMLAVVSLAGAALGGAAASYLTGSSAAVTRDALTAAAGKVYEDDKWTDEKNEATIALKAAASVDPTMVGPFTVGTLLVGLGAAVAAGVGAYQEWSDLVVAFLASAGGGALGTGAIYGGQVDAAHTAAVRQLNEDFPGLAKAVQASAVPGSKAWQRGIMAG